MTAEATPNESELIRRFKRGDGEAFDILMARCEHILQACIERRLNQALRRRLSVADVLQEARMKAFHLRHDFEDRGDGSFRKWLMAIADREAMSAAHHHVRAAKRSVDREVTRIHRKETAGYPGREASPSQAAIGIEMEGLARQAMESLSEEYQKILHLTHVEHLSLGEAAERLGRSREVVKKLYSRAFLAFTTAFHQSGGQDHA